MGDISKHFSRNEFACSDQCGFEAVDVELLSILEWLREEYKKPVIIHCACRCLNKNREVGSKDSSQHIRGLAVDFHIPDVPNDKIAYKLGKKMGNRGGIGIYGWGVHADVRHSCARWDKTK
jgi:uncharacterized protein YcbK (DUF882 family)